MLNLKQFPAHRQDELRTDAVRTAPPSPVISPDVSPVAGHPSQRILRGTLVPGAIGQHFNHTIGCRALGCGHTSAQTQTDGAKHGPSNRPRQISIREHPVHNPHPHDDIISQRETTLRGAGDEPAALGAALRRELGARYAQQDAYRSGSNDPISAERGQASDPGRPSWVQVRSSPGKTPTMPSGRMQACSSGTGWGSGLV